MLAARLPAEIVSDFHRAKLDAGEALGGVRVTSEVGLEALVRALQRPEVWAAWVQEVERMKEKGR